MKPIPIVAAAMSLGILGCSTPVTPTGSTVARTCTVRQEDASSGARLAFLENVPEFHELDLAITEAGLAAVVEENGSLIRTTRDEGSKIYHVYRKDGENVIVMFTGGECTGIQRMRPDPAGVPRREE